MADVEKLVQVLAAPGRCREHRGGHRAQSGRHGGSGLDRRPRPRRRRRAAAASSPRAIPKPSQRKPGKSHTAQFLGEFLQRARRSLARSRAVISMPATSLLSFRSPWLRPGERSPPRIRRRAARADRRRHSGPLGGRRLHRAFWRGHLGTGVAIFALAHGLLLIWWKSLRPSNDRDWADDVAQTVGGTIDGGVVTLDKVRDFEWRSSSDYTPRWTRAATTLRNCIRST